MHVVIPISADALRKIFEANGWKCIGETTYFFAMRKDGMKDEPFFIPRIGTLVPVETMEQADEALGAAALIRGITPDVISDAAKRFAADTDDD